MSFSDPLNPRGRLLLYASAIFLSSAFLLVLEIAAGRLLAPYIGVSLYTWTSIIGVILAGLSLGNWFGGVWADRGGNETSAGLTLAIGGLFSLAILLLLSFIAPVVQRTGLSLLSSSFIYVLFLFFIPAALLGVVTPLLTTLALHLDKRTGHVVGKLHALAALGSIFGTFIAGYWLVQWFGTRNVILGTSAGLFLLAIPFLWRAPRKLPAIVLAAAVALVGATYGRTGFADPCETESNYFCMRVVDQSRMVPFGTARALVLDHLIHGINHETEPGMMISPYIHLMDELVIAHYGAEKINGLRFFFAGGGAYTQPRATQALYQNADITVAELDPVVTRIATEQLYLNTDGMRIIHRDARVVLDNLEGEKFDVISSDAFHDVSIPYHLVTREFIQLVKSRLKPNGLYTLNVIDAAPDPRLIKSMYKTLKTVFKDVNIWIDTLPKKPERMTYVLSAGDSHQPPPLIVAQRGFNQRWYNITDILVATGTSLGDLPLLTDDYAPVERLTSDLLLTELGR